MRSRMKIYIAISFVLIMVLGILPSTVSASLSRSNDESTVTISQQITVDKDPRFNFTSLMNLANTTDMKYSNYNLTVKPFLDNNTDKAGIIITPYFAPFIFNSTVASLSTSVGSFFMLSSQTIMDGASEIWLRCPIVDIDPENHLTRIRVYSVNDPLNFNMSFVGGVPTFDDETAQNTIYDMTDDPNAWTWAGINSIGTTFGGVWNAIPNNYYSGYAEYHPNWIRQQVQYPNSTPMNFTWFKVCVGLFPSEWYFFLIDYVDANPGELKIALSTCDFGQDGKENSWLNVDGVNYFGHFDLDTTMIVTYGISNGITGIGVRSERGIVFRDVESQFHMNASIPFNRIIDKDYLNIVVPFLLNTSYKPSLDLTVNITLYLSQDDSAPFLTWKVAPKTYTGTHNVFIQSVNVQWFHTAGTYLDHLRIDFSVQGGTGAYARATMIKLWGTRDANTSSTTTGFTNIYWMARYHSSDWSFNRQDYLVYEKVGFIPYGYYGLSASHYATTDKSMIAIPTNTPKTPLGIYFAIQGYNLWLISEAIKDAIKKVFETGINFIWDSIVDNLDTIWMLLSPITWAFYHWILEPILNWLGGIWEGIFLFFVGIGIWFGQVIDFVIDALEWFSYWMVRFIYSFSLIMVYLVNVFGVISICSGLVAYSRTGKGRDFYRAFKSGWRVCYGIIAFMLGLMIMAISTLGAVIPL